MKIKLYVRPGDDPVDVANKVKIVIAEKTKKTCIVKLNRLNINKSR